MIDKIINILKNKNIVILGFVTDIELKAIAQILNVSCDTLLGIDMPIK